MISAVILAVGRAENMKEAKATQPPGGKPVLQCVLESAVVSALSEIICVTADLNYARRQIKIADDRLLWLLSSAADGGQSAAVIAGLWAIHPSSEGVMFLGAEAPIISGELINALIAKFHQSSALIIASSFKGKVGNPLVFRRRLFPEILQLTGDRRENALLAKYHNQTAMVEWNEERSAGLEDRENVESTGELN